MFQVLSLILAGDNKTSAHTRGGFWMLLVLRTIQGDSRFSRYGFAVLLVSFISKQSSEAQTGRKKVSEIPVWPFQMTEMPFRFARPHQPSSPTLTSSKKCFRVSVWGEGREGTNASTQALKQSNEIVCCCQISGEDSLESHFRSPAAVICGYESLSVHLQCSWRVCLTLPPVTFSIQSKCCRAGVSRGIQIEFTQAERIGRRIALPLASCFSLSFSWKLQFFMHGASSYAATDVSF